MQAGSYVARIGIDPRNEEKFSLVGELMSLLVHEIAESHLTQRIQSSFEDSAPPDVGSLATGKGSGAQMFGDHAPLDVPLSAAPASLRYFRGMHPG